MTASADFSPEHLSIQNFNRHTWLAALQHVTAADYSPLFKRLRQLEQRLKTQSPSDRNADKLRQDIERSAQIVAERHRRLPSPTFSADLPVNQKLDALKLAIQNHQVVIICGETGSGKTTQIPKLCLSLGRGTRGLIGHTQPRRIAARSVAQRLAQELNSRIGESVGFKVRFTDKTAPHSFIKLMTDGILLAETQTDRLLTQYDTIIIDEAHERSLNIDFLLGYLKQILPRRPDLKVIITSATIDADRFANHFSQNGHPAPVIEVSGRTFPVEIRYRPLHAQDADDADLEMETAIVDAVTELHTHARGDILVFLAGEREIRDTADALRKARLNCDILPLFARLSVEEQNRIFQPNHGAPRVILSTNVAETSLTISGIKYVIDTGLARVKRYSPRARVEQLLVEKISQAAARQRAGRCGRIEAGICIRLYSEDDFNARPAFTDPEIVRSNLGAVILRMASLRLGALADFPFIDAPSSRLIADGITLLHELGALDTQQQLTPLGQELARLPIDPKIGRMLLAARDFHCLDEMLILAAALSIQDPRERPFEAREAADRAHQAFRDNQSDFVALLNIWHSFQDALQQQKLSNRQRIAWCHQRFLSHLRMREWRELHAQLERHTTELTLTRNTQPATFEQLHSALLTGLLGHIGFKSSDNDDYLGARGIHFHIFPASGLRRNKPKWLFAAELTETSKLYARTVAAIDPAWIEPLAPHLVKKHYFEPHWSKSRGEVIATERVTLYGLPIVPRRTVSYARVNAAEAREIFIREALAVGDYQTRAPFFKHNQKLIQEIEQLEHKARRQDVLVDEQALFDFYQARIPADIVDAASFEAWLKTLTHTEPRRLHLTREFLMQHAAEHVTETQFPEQFLTPDGSLKLRYRFEPNHVLDGVTVDIPLPLLNRLAAEPFEWLVPGMIREKITFLIKSLPKNTRRLCVPVPDFVTRFLSSAPSTQHSLAAQLSAYINRETGAHTHTQDFDLKALPPHHNMNFRILDDGQQELGLGRDLAALQHQFGDIAQLTFRDSSQEFERDHVSSWDFGALPPTIKFARGRQQLTGYPALTLEHDQLALRLFDTEAAAELAHRKGVVYLVKTQLKEHVKQLQKGWSGYTQTALALRGLIHNEALLDDAINAIFDRAVIGDDALPRDEAAFEAQKSRARARLPAVTQMVAQLLSAIAAEYQALAPHLSRHPLKAEAQKQLNTLIYKDFLQNTPYSQWTHLPRYLKALRVRLEKYPHHPARDRTHQAEIDALYEVWQQHLHRLQQHNAAISAEIAHFRWHIEELRVSLFAQELKTPYPVSVKRLQKIWAGLIAA